MKKHILFTRILNAVVIICLLSGLRGLGQNQHLIPPSWLKDVPETSEWWATVVLKETPGKIVSNNWTTLAQMEKRITAMVLEGVSPVRERREAIKFIDLFDQSSDLSPDARFRLRTLRAGMFQSLGEYRMAAKAYTKLVDQRPDMQLFQILASQYERIGRSNDAIRIYEFLKRTYTNDGFASDVARAGLVYLRGDTNPCGLIKPKWWADYQQSPEWWTNIVVDLPAISCFQDGLAYIANYASGDKDRWKTKAYILLSQRTPLTCGEASLALTLGARAYARIGDHHRAIVTAWPIPERFWGDFRNATNSLAFIVTELENLGETDNARNIRNLIPCFKREKA